MNPLDDAWRQLLAAFVGLSEHLEFRVNVIDMMQRDSLRRTDDAEDGHRFTAPERFLVQENSVSLTTASSF